MLNKLKMEFIGTFFLLFTVAATGNALAVGAVLAALVYMGCYISGAHYNPAVTMAALVAKKIKQADAIKYIITQFIAAFLAAVVFDIIYKKKVLPAIATDANFVSAFVVEALFTFLLASVVLHVAATEKTKNNSYFGIAIGFTLLAAAFAGGPISGGAFNPAVGISPLLYDFMNLETHIPNISVYLLGPTTGGILAGLMYKSMHK